MATATKKKTETKPDMLVRIHPPNRRLGRFAESFTLSGSGYPKFRYQAGWYTVDYRTAMKLIDVRNNPNDPSSKLVFEVCSAREAKALDRAEKVEKAKANKPIPIPPKIASKNKRKGDVEEAVKTAPADDDMDLTDDVDDEEWDEIADDDAIEAPAEVIETADEEEDDDLDSLIDPEPAPQPKKATKKKVTKKRAAKKKTKKTTKKRS